MEREVSHCIGALPLQLYEENACKQGAHLVKYCLSESGERERESEREREREREREGERERERGEGKEGYKMGGWGGLKRWGGRERARYGEVDKGEGRDGGTEKGGEEGGSREGGGDMEKIERFKRK